MNRGALRLALASAGAAVGGALAPVAMWTAVPEATGLRSVAGPPPSYLATATVAALASLVLAACAWRSSRWTQLSALAAWLINAMAVVATIPGIGQAVRNPVRTGPGVWLALGCFFLAFGLAGTSLSVVSEHRRTTRRNRADLLRAAERIEQALWPRAVWAPIEGEPG